SFSMRRTGTCFIFFFQAEDGIRHFHVTGVQTCALPIYKSAAGPNFMKQMAATAARVELAQTMQVELQNMIKQYAETTGVGDSETVDMVNTSVTKQITKETLIGSKIFRQMPTPTGGMVVLVGLDADTVDRKSTRLNS